MLVARSTGLGSDFLRFLAELADHNDRKWFEANKARYESNVRDPFLGLIAALGPQLERLDPPFSADPSPVGGSMMRIYRDIRFASDKSPYKTAMAAHFWPVSSKGDGVPALHLRIAPGKSSFGGGLWRPAPPLAKKVRDAIAGDPARWRKIMKDLGHDDFRPVGESLKRVPPGYDADSPVAEDLKRKDFIIVFELTDRQATSGELPDVVASRCRAAMPYMRFLFDAIGRSPGKRAR